LVDDHKFERNGLSVKRSISPTLYRIRFIGNPSVIVVAVFGVSNIGFRTPQPEIHSHAEALSHR